MKTRMIEILGIKYPTMQGGIQHLGMLELASAVSEAGGLGTVNVTIYPDLKDLRKAIRKVKRMTGRPFTINISPIPSLHPGKEFFDQISVILEEGMPAIETTGASSQELTDILNVHRDQVKWIHKTACVEHAKKVENAGADLTTMAGFEMVDHLHTDGARTVALANRTARKVKVPVLAAGGIVDGRGLLATLSLNCEGIVMETRFVASKERLVHQSQKEWIVNSDESRMILCQKNIRNMARVVNNEAAKKCLELELRGASLEELTPVISEKHGKAAYRGGDMGEDMFAVGPSYGLTHEVKICREILDSITEEVEQCLDRLSVVQGNR